MVRTGVPASKIDGRLADRLVDVFFFRFLLEEILLLPSRLDDELHRYSVHAVFNFRLETCSSTERESC